jgi:hypothetical protein
MNHFEESRNRETPGIIPPHGGYKDLQSYQMSEIVYDGTVVFCDRFISPPLGPTARSFRLWREWP